MKKLTLLGFAALLSLSNLAACTAESSDDAATGEEQDIKRRPEQAQMNDVSVLYPMATKQSEFDGGYLTPSSVGLGGALLPASLYTTATGEPKTAPPNNGNIGSDRGLVWDEFKVVAFRVDPCFANLGPITADTKCDNQLRLIMQPLSMGEDGASAVDGAIHAFYSISREDLVALVKELIKVRQQGAAKALGALAVHPLLAKEGLLGDTAKAMNALVLKYAGTKNLVRFTVLKPGNLATKWDFRGFDIASGGKATAMEIPSLPAKTTDVSFFAGFGRDLSGGFTPSTKSKDSMQILGNLADAQKASKDAQQAAIDASLRIENPTMHSPNTIDCASCHVAGPSMILTGGSLGLTTKSNPNAFQRDPKLVAAADMKQTTPVNDDTSRNFHAFSYRDTHPMISLRVINETASVVAFLNATVLK